MTHGKERPDDEIMILFQGLLVGFREADRELFSEVILGALERDAGKVETAVWSLDSSSARGNVDNQFDKLIDRTREGANQNCEKERD